MDGPERKRLKSTHPPAAGSSSQATLPPGWTEHTAPSGVKYYYNAETKKSTYTRPVAAPIHDIPPSPSQLPANSSFPAQTHYPGNTYGSQQYQAPAGYNAFPQSAYTAPYRAFPDAAVPNSRQERNRHIYDNRQQRRPQPQDRPKRKAAITNCPPWLLIYTKLGRRFVHNTETGESLWKFPPEIMKAVVEFDRLELEEKLAGNKQVEGGKNGDVQQKAPASTSQARTSPSPQQKEEEFLGEEAAHAGEDERIWRPPVKTAEDNTGSDSEYEEVEVTDDEDEENSGAEHDESKAPPQGPVEFTEDDIAYQLAAMEGEYDDPDADEPFNDEPDPNNTAEPSLSDADRETLFHDMLSDHDLSPYTPWETLISSTSPSSILHDDRYTILPSSRARKAAHDAWSKARIAAQKAAKAKAQSSQSDEDAHLGPKIVYLELLDKHASAKLYWPEFRRKFKKDAALRDAKVPEKEKERLYREHVSRLKLGREARERDLEAVLRDVPLRLLNRATDVGGLPARVSADIRYISLGEKEREAVVASWIAGLAPAPEMGDVLEEEEDGKARKERERRANAMRDRERRVEEEKKQQERDLRIGRGRLKEGERELEEAMRIGKNGLRAQLVEESRDEGHEQ